jgi:hypothetical protein
VANPTAPSSSSIISFNNSFPKPWPPAFRNTQIQLTTTTRSPSIG